MTSRLLPKTIAISQIDFSDRTFSLLPVAIDFCCPEALTDSIKRFGILHPPVIREKSRDSYAVVTGWKRLEALRRVAPEADHCLCLVAPASLPDIDVFSFQLEEIELRRNLSPVERATLLKKIHALAGLKEIPGAILQHLSLPSDPAVISKAASLLELENEIIEAVHHGTISGETASELHGFSVPDRQALFRVMRLLHPGANYQKKLINTCRELASRQNIAVADFLQHEEIIEIISHGKANPPQRLKNLMHWLSRQHSPRNSQAEDDFKRFAASLGLPEDIALEHTPFFEDDSLTLSIHFTDRKSLQDSWQLIKNAINRKKN